jgi:DNA repair photolyase
LKSITWDRETIAEHAIAINVRVPSNCFPAVLMEGAAGQKHWRSAAHDQKRVSKFQRRAWMPLKKPTGNMYSDIDLIWNPVKGRCIHDCSYCYVKRIVVNRFKSDMKPIHLDKKEFRENLGKGNTIFVCDSCDLFASDVPMDFIHWVTGYCHQFPKNTYLFQTKNPRRLVSSIIRIIGDKP